MCPHCKRPGCRVGLVLDDGFETCAVAIADTYGPLKLQTIADVLGFNSRQSVNDALNAAYAAFQASARRMGFRHLAPPLQRAAA